MLPIAPSALVHEFETIHTHGTTDSNNNNLCVKDNIFDVVVEDRDNVTILKEGKVVICDENKAYT